MKEQIKEYIKKEISQLENGKATSIKLSNVCPSDLESVIGELEDLDFNGWQGDYWGKTDEYSVFGTMYYGTVTISLKTEEDE